MQKRNKKGFTLVELVIVIAVIAILAGVLIGTFAGVISRANQSKAVQEWKAAVDAAYVEFMADEHVVPSFVNVIGKTITFKKNSDVDTDKALPTVTYKITGNRAVADETLASFVVLDAENKVYFIWNTNGTYAVVSTNAALSSASKNTSFTDNSQVETPTSDVLVPATLQTLTYNDVTYYGLPVENS